MIHWLHVQFGDSDEEAIVETLERERKEWHTERVQLIPCIHMQQLELSQRAIAAQDRAADIAKDFAQVIASFEERLVSIEENVQKELMAVKTITSNLTHAVAALTNALPQLKHQT
jgi:4-hydroxy-L-threonine phosphate dehydrogenase PdxA